MEYQRSLIADFAHVHRQFVRAKTLQEALAWIVSGRHSFRTRSLARCIQIAVMALGEEPVTSLALAQDLLELNLRSLLVDRFYHRVSLLPDSINCDLIVAGHKLEPDSTYAVADTCQKETASCFLPDFLASHRPELRAITDYLAAHPNTMKDQERVLSLLTSVLVEPRAALGQMACWPLGDVIVALGTPADAALWTLDGDFQPLAAALGLQLYARSQ